MNRAPGVATGFWVRAGWLLPGIPETALGGECVTCTSMGTRSAVGSRSLCGH